MSKATGASTAPAVRLAGEFFCRHQCKEEFYNLRTLMSLISPLLCSNQKDYGVFHAKGAAWYSHWYSPCSFFEHCWEVAFIYSQERFDQELSYFTVWWAKKVPWTRTWRASVWIHHHKLIDIVSTSADEPESPLQSHKIDPAFMIAVFLFSWLCHSSASLCVWCRKKMCQEGISNSPCLGASRALSINQRSWLLSRVWAE